MDLLGQIMVIALFVGIIILCYLPFHKVYKKYKSVKILNGRSKKEENNLYFREVPNINNKATGVALLTNENDIYRVIQATILELEIAGNLNLNVNEKKETVIQLNKNQPDRLKITQRMILNYIRRLMEGQEEITIEEFKSRMFRNRKLFKAVFGQDFLEYGIKEQEELGNWNKRNREYDDYTRDFMKVLPLFFVAFMTLTYTFLDKTIMNGLLRSSIFAISMIAILFDFLTQIKIIIKMKKECKKVKYTIAFNTNAYVRLTKKGLEERKQWKLLEKYLKEYSLIKDYDIKSIEVNKEFLVYATLFGIADKVQDQLGKYGPLVVYWDQTI